MKIDMHDSFKGSILVCSMCFSEIDEKAIDSLIREFSILIKHRKSLITYQRVIGYPLLKKKLMCPLVNTSKFNKINLKRVESL